MQFAATARVLGILLMIFSLSMLPPIAIAAWYHDGDMIDFWVGFSATLSTGLLLWLPTRRKKHDLKTRDGFLIVVLFWLVLSLFGAIPFAMAEYPHSLTDAIFEAVSGLTTTGAEVFSNIDQLPHAVRYYHQQLLLFGGMGIIVLAVAILPMLGIGGAQLYKAETPGPIKDQKLTPRLAQTAKTLWYIYVGLITLCALAFWAAGMTLFEAVGEAFSAISTGGFSVHNASFAYYHSTTINLIAILFMILGATSFSLHFSFLQQRRWRAYFKDIECRTMWIIYATVSLLVIVTLLHHHTYRHSSESIIHAVFTVVSLGTTTGWTTTNFSTWPTFTPFIIMLTALIGGSAGSTGGGLKVIRALLLKKQVFREIKRLLHPKAITTIKLGDQRLGSEVLEATWSFMAVFLALFVILLLGMLATGVDFTTSFGALSACIANAGAGIGKVGNGFGNLNAISKWILIVAMLAGRLEIFTLLVLFTPTFWRD